MNCKLEDFESRRYSKLDGETLKGQIWWLPCKHPNKGKQLYTRSQYWWVSALEKHSKWEINKSHFQIRFSIQRYGPKLVHVRKLFTQGGEMWLWHFSLNQDTTNMVNIFHLTQSGAWYREKWFLNVYHMWKIGHNEGFTPKRKNSKFVLPIQKLLLHLVGLGNCSY